MLKSMTAFGRSFSDTLDGRFSVEIQSVNRKHLEINCFLPRELQCFEADIRKWVGNAVQRGQVTVKVYAYFKKSSPLVVRPNLALALQLKEAWDAIASHLKIEAKFELGMLKEEVGILLYEENLQAEDKIRSELESVVQAALVPFLNMKVKEGEALSKDIELRLVNLAKYMELIEVKSQGSTNKFRQKLTERIREVAAGCSDNEDKILREVAIYAEKIDISEEITRFKSHLKQVNNLIKTTQDSVGKTFEFLIQELNREVNTTGSKSNDIEVTKLVVEIKSELERIREQIQNIE